MGLQGIYLGKLDQGDRLFAVMVCYTIIKMCGKNIEP